MLTVKDVVTNQAHCIYLSPETDNGTRKSGEVVALFDQQNALSPESDIVEYDGYAKYPSVTGKVASFADDMLPMMP